MCPTYLVSVIFHLELCLFYNIHCVIPTTGLPELLQFSPYNKDQIIEILQERLKDVSLYSLLFQPCFLFQSMDPLVYYSLIILEDFFIFI